MFKKISYILLGMTLMVSGTVLAAPYFTYQRTLLPETNNAFDLGTTTSVWRDLFVTQICLSGDCKSAWPTGGSGGAFSWTVNSWGNSTSTTLGFLNGFLSTASSTISSSLRLPSISQGFLYTGSTGLVQPIASSSIQLSWFNNDSGFITSYTETDPIVKAINGIVKSNGSAISAASNGTDYTLISASACSAGSHVSEITAAGVITCSADTGSGGSGLASSTPWAFGSLVVAKDNGSVTTISTSTIKTSELTNDAGFLTSYTSPYEIATTSTISVPQLSYFTNVSGRTTLGGVSTSTLTASSPLTGSFIQIGSGGSIGCQTASASQAGCLGASDFSKFNSATTTFTWPLIYTGATNAVTYGGFGTTSDTGIGNNLILYTNNAGIIKGVASSSLSLPNTALQNSTISGVSLGSNLNSLSVSGSITGTSYNGSAGVSNWALNMANANTWTALQTFGNSTTTYGSFSISSSTDAYFGTGQGIAIIGSLGRIRAVATSTFSLSQFTNDLANLTALDTSLTFSGSYNGSAARTVGLNTGRTNTWTVLQNFNYSSSTIYSSFLTASSTFGNIGTLTLSTTTTGCLNTGSTGIVYASTCASGASTGPINVLQASDGANGFIATGTPQLTVGNILATTTATSTFSGPVVITATTNNASIFKGFSAFADQYPTKVTGSERVIFEDSDGNNSDWSFRVAGGGWGTLNFASSLGTLASPTSLSINDVTGNIGFYGHDGTGYIEQSSIKVVTDAVPSTNNVPSRMVFSVNKGGSSATEVVRIDSRGNFGIATTAPQWKLSVASTTMPQIALLGNNTDNIWTMRGIGNNFYLATSSPTTYATSSVSAFSINANGFPTFPSLGTGLVLSTAGLQSTYAGTTCTNQFVRVLSASGAATCATVASTDVSLANLTATNSTLTFSGTYNGSTARTIGLNLGNANTWTAKQTFGAASSTQFSISGWLGIPNATDPTVGTTGTLAINTTQASTSLRYYDGTAERALFDTFDKPTIYASSTLAYDGAYSGSATTTYSSVWNPSHALTLVSLYCKTDTGTVWYEVGTGSATSTVQCTSTGASSNTSVNFTLRQSVMEALGRQSGNPSRITVTPTFRYQAD